MDRKDGGGLGKSDPFFTITRAGPVKAAKPGKKAKPSKIMVYRSEFVKDNLSPTWREFTLSFQDQLNGYKTT